MESLQEGVDLRLDGTSHSQLGHQLDVLCLKDTHMRTHAHTNTSILHFTWWHRNSGETWWPSINNRVFHSLKRVCVDPKRFYI